MKKLIWIGIITTALTIQAHACGCCIVVDPTGTPTNVRNKPNGAIIDPITADTVTSGRGERRLGLGRIWQGWYFFEHEKGLGISQVFTVQLKAQTRAVRTAVNSPQSHQTQAKQRLSSIERPNASAPRLLNMTSAGQPAVPAGRDSADKRQHATPSRGRRATLEHPPAHVRRLKRACDLGKATKVSKRHPVRNRTGCAFRAYGERVPQPNGGRTLSKTERVTFRGGVDRDATPPCSRSP
jgi:hypothetical protein